MSKGDSKKSYALIYQTTRTTSVCFSDVGGTDYWFPIDKVEFDDEGIERGDEVDVLIPVWLAEDRGLA